MAEHKEKVITEDIIPEDLITEDIIVDNPLAAIVESPRNKHKVGKQRVSDYSAATIIDDLTGSPESSELKKKAAKALANHLWYLANKAKKQQYNEQYYKNNIDYWRKRYNEDRAERDGEIRKLEKERDALISEATARKNPLQKSTKKGDFYDEFNRGIDKYNSGIDEYNDTVRSMFNDNIKRTRKEYDDYLVGFDAENLKRAHREYQEFLDSQKKMSFSDAWKEGAKSITSSGKKFISKLLGR